MDYEDDVLGAEEKGFEDKDLDPDMLDASLDPIEEDDSLLDDTMY
jgi:hypothetical protein